jgi:hypothetical protein
VTIGHQKLPPSANLPPSGQPNEGVTGETIALPTSALEIIVKYRTTNEQQTDNKWGQLLQVRAACFVRR